ncbi:hypothetical protein B0T18DRAFT_199441 [Schizothecium vesticola]|uniref:Uncharacterized protein n=1 Tax=Schizothecium vesticola TaxID=314040 RepID=A0AA40K365_9PEZI|nr:hypothetical protein B0T18DRAFT_199441 [Schizothecium vesticola]
MGEPGGSRRTVGRGRAAPVRMGVGGVQAVGRRYKKSGNGRLQSHLLFSPHPHKSSCFCSCISFGTITFALKPNNHLRVVTLLTKMMNKFLLLGALPAVLASPPHGVQTTKTVYATTVHTVTSCKPEVTNCPAKKGPVVVTEVVAVSTTVCAVTDIETSTRAPVGCSTATSVSDCVHTITKTAAPATTITKEVEVVSTSTCVHTIPGDKPQTVTTLIPTTYTSLVMIVLDWGC